MMKPEGRPEVDFTLCKQCGKCIEGCSLKVLEPAA